MNSYKVSAGTIARTIILAIALINQLLSATGHPVLPIEDAQVEQLVTAAFTIITSLIAYWKNNSWTTAAIKADNFLNREKTRV